MKNRYLLYTFVIFTTYIALAESCTRVLWSNNGQSVIVGRTMDWKDSTEPEMWVFPRGREQNGGSHKTAAKWTSKYGSFVVMARGYVTVDGINEAKLVGHIHYFKESNYGDHDEGTPTITTSRWLQYILDHYGTVKEAVADAKNWHIIPSTKNNKEAATLHIALEDASGDSAIIQYLNGKPHIYHGKEHTVLTNEPAYPLLLKNRESYKGFGGSLPLPGERGSEDRFVRASFYLNLLPPPMNSQEAVTSLMSILRTLSKPFSTPQSTHYRTLTDITNGCYYFEYARNINIIWIDLTKIDFTENGKVLYLNPQEPNLAGECNHLFEEKEYQL